MDGFESHGPEDGWINEIKIIGGADDDESIVGADAVECRENAGDIEWGVCV